MTYLAETRKRLRELLAEFDVINNTLGWNESQIDTIHEVESECVAAMPALLNRIDALERAVGKAANPLNCPFCGSGENKWGHMPDCIVLTLPRQEP